MKFDFGKIDKRIDTYKKELTGVNQEATKGYVHYTMGCSTCDGGCKGTCEQSCSGRCGGGCGGSCKGVAW